MAQVSSNKIVFDIDDWQAGLHFNYDLNTTDTPIPIGGKLATAMRAFNPFRQGSFGYAAPGFPVNAVDNASLVTQSAMRRIEMAYDTNAGAMKGFGVNSDTKLFRLSAQDGSIDSSGSWPHTVTGVGGTAQLNDVLSYVLDGDARIFYSYNNVGDNTWDIGMYSLDGTAPNDDFMSTIPTNPLVPTGESNPHPMIWGDVDDVLYFADGNTVYGFDGGSPTGTVFTALVLPGTFRIQSFAKLNQRLAIFGYFQPQATAEIDLLPTANVNAKVYFWDYLNLDPYDSVDLSDSFVTCGFQYKSTVGCFTQGRPGALGSKQPAKIQIYTGSRFETLVTFDARGDATTNALPFNGSYDVMGDSIIWQSLGSVYQYGPAYPGGDSKLFKTVLCTGSETGAIRILDAETIVVSSGASAGGDGKGLEYFEVTPLVNEYSAGFFRSQLISPSFPPGQMGWIKSMKVEFAELTDPGLVLDLAVVGNNTPYTLIQEFTQVSATQVTLSFLYDDAASTLPSFTDIALVLNWTGNANEICPLVKRVEIDYDTINTVNTTLT